MARNSKLILNDLEGQRYKFVENEQSGDYNLIISSVNYHFDNGKYYCTVLDSTTNRQLLSTPANIVVVG